MSYTNLDEFAEIFPFSHNVQDPNEFKLFLIGETEEKRMALVVGVKKVLEEMLDEAKQKKELEYTGVQVFDLSLGDRKEMSDLIEYQILPKSGKVPISGRMQHGVYIPIFHNSDRFPELPQCTWDDHKPGIFSLTQKGYLKVFNPSKRECFDILRA
ncbi:hypothetical protein KA107_00740 [Candidatus Pacearchaeota archaeon]|nr:hypothetical protein [Candidatus Pacearchaeota archaeon]